MEKKIDKREELLQLDKEKKKLEEKIASLTDFLTQPGMPGINGSLIDKDGFPKEGLDLVTIRTVRHDLICAQNDLKNLMEIIEKKMMAYFEELNKDKIEEESKEEEKKSNSNIKEETTADACSEDKNNNNIQENLKEPFAKIVNVEKGSPADEAGLKPEDDIIVFNGILYKGASHNPLNTLADIVRNKIGQQIPISIVRKNSDNILQVVNLDIIPHTWNGKGVLGCKFQIIP
jgi:26S proteasome non-ATPase regulatory subunit 9